MLRLVGIAIPVVALALGSAAFAQEKKPEAPKAPEAKKPEAKPEEKKPEVKKEEPKKDEAKDLVATIGASADHKTLAELIKIADIAKDLDGVTIFAPTDAAFKAVPGLEDLKKDKAKLAAVLKGHIVKGKAEMKGELKPLAGDAIKVETKDGKTMLNGKINVVGKEIVAKNGAIYVIDGVFAGEKKAEPKKEEPKKEEPKKPEPKKEEPKKP
jgi:uncharacterized surface protein with fasciclin (FAS1) repeats